MQKFRKCHIRKNGILYIPAKRSGGSLMAGILFCGLMALLFILLGYPLISGAFLLIICWLFFYVPAAEISADGRMYRTSSSLGILCSEWFPLKGYERVALSGAGTVDTERDTVTDKEIYILLEGAASGSLALAHYTSVREALDTARLLARHTRLQLYSTLEPEFFDTEN